MIMFLFNEYPMLDYKEWIRDLTYNAESNFIILRALAWMQIEIL